MSDYQLYLKSDHWQELRKAAFERWGPRCHACRSDEFVQIHHLYYGDVYKRTTDDVMPLCSRCHGVFHELAVKPYCTNESGDNTWRRRATVNVVREAIGAKENAEAFAKAETKRRFLGNTMERSALVHYLVGIGKGWDRARTDEISMQELRDSAKRGWKPRRRFINRKAKRRRDKILLNFSGELLLKQDKRYVNES